MRYELWWTSEDGENEICMGIYETREAAEAGKAEATDELLDQARYMDAHDEGPGNQVERVMRGSWDVRTVR